MDHWDFSALDVQPHAPRVLSSAPEGRAVALVLPAGEHLTDHQVHERAWIVVLGGEVEISTAAGRVAGGTGLVAELAPNERHAVLARTDARLLLLLTPWPGEGHPGARP